MNHEHHSGLVKLTGRIKNYKVTRTEASFVFTDGDRNTMGVVAIAAAVAGLAGPAVATAANAGSADEDADYVEFDLDGKAVKGWVWRSPFKEGDHVEVAAELRGDHYEAAGIARPDDRTIALYPHCSRGRMRHGTNALKWWLVGSSAFFCLVVFILWTAVSSERFLTVVLNNFHYPALSIFVFFGLMTFSLTRQWMPFVRLAEKVFRTLGWARPGYVDLVKSTKAQRKPDDPGELGAFYYRY